MNDMYLTGTTILKAYESLSLEAFKEYIAEISDGVRNKPELGVSELVELCYQDNLKAGWHDNPREKGTMLMLIVTEIAEAMEGERKDLMDDKLTHRKMAEVELADTIIRICDYAGKYGYDLSGAITAKLEFNRHREDHRREVRALAGGKKF